MIDHTAEMARNGGELVMEFLYEQNSGFSQGTMDRMLKSVLETYQCTPDLLCITDNEANQLINKLHTIACERQLEIASMSATL